MTQSSPQPSMPGAFNFSQRDQGAVPRLSGAKSHIFQPPRTPSVSASSSLYLTRSASHSAMSTDHNTSVNAGKKRSRVDYDAPYEEWTDGTTPGSPRPLANTKYVLAGGLDTPGMAASRIEDARDSDYFSDVGYRRDLSDDTKLQGMLGEESRYQSFAPLGLDGEEDTSRRSSRQYMAQGQTWNALGVVGGVFGGVVGKVWEFCKTSAFRGFHAGGGKGYAVSTNDAMHPTIEQGSFWETEKSVTTYGLIDRQSTPLPGQFPTEDFIPNYMDRPTPEETPPRAAKRRQVDDSRDELATNWVVVPPTNTQTPTKPRPTPTSRYSMPTASSASRRPGPGRPASRAGMAPGALPRRPTLQSRVSHAGSPALQSRAGASFASPRSPGGSKIPRASPVKPPATLNNDSPAAREAQRWASMKRKEEREADESIRRLDAQLKAMIREGKEALGTKVEVESEVDDNYVSPRKFNAGKAKKWGV